MTLKRQLWIDYFKGLLVIGMILGHCIQFFGDESSVYQGVTVRLINLISFSGFVFAYGYVMNEVYFERGFRESIWRMIVSGTKILSAYYISSFAFIAFVEYQIFRWDTVWKVLLLGQFAGWSEFLIAFVILVLISIVFFNVLARANRILLLVLMGVSVISSLLPYAVVESSHVALLIGSYAYITFPVVQYFVWFLLGIYLSRYKSTSEIRLFILSIIATMTYVLYSVVMKEEAPRFPPSPYYVLGGALILYTYRWFCIKMEKNNSANRYFRKILAYIESLGKASLYYLLLSNVLIFGFAQSSFSYKAGGYAISFYIILMIVLRYIQIIGHRT